MTYETKDNSGSLFKNDRKEKETHPDYNGQARIDGHDYWISAWLKEGNGKKFFSFSFKRKDGTAERPQSNDRPVMDNTKAGGFVDLSDDVPFACEAR